MDQSSLLKSLAEILDTKLDQKLKDRSHIEKEILDEMKTSMIEVWQTEAEKFFRQQTTL
jgi:hypothetical protein